MDYLLWLPFSWLKAIGEAFAGDGESNSEQSDGSINMPATMSVKDKFNCPNTTTDKCPPVQKMQDLVFGLPILIPVKNNFSCLARIQQIECFGEI